MERDQRASDLKPESAEGGGKTQQTEGERPRQEKGRQGGEEVEERRKMVDQRRATNLHYYYVNHYAF